MFWCVVGLLDVGGYVCWVGVVLYYVIDELFVYEYLIV